MSGHRLYIGNTRDPQFQWGRDNHGLLPEEILDLGPFSDAEHYQAARTLLLSADYRGVALDEDTVGALASKVDILDFVNGLPQDPAWVKNTVAKVETLPHDEQFVIVVYRY